MGFFEKYPNTNFHELNLDWLLNKMRELEIEFDEFKVVNNITFSGQWDITKQYPAWTIVSDNNIGYVSQKPVPAGVTLSDGNYWVEVIDYTAQIAGLENRVIALENTVGDASSGLVKDVDDLQALTTSMAAKITNIDNPYLLVIGDSYSALPESDWAETLADELNMRLIKNAVGSMGFSHAVGGQVFEDCLSFSYDNDRRDNTRIVLCYGGINDYDQAEADIYTAVKSFINTAKSMYPYAQIMIVGPQMRATTVNDIAKMVQKNAIKNAMYKACSELGVSYTDAKYFLIDAATPYTDNYLTDNLHPSALGYKIIASRMAELIKGNINMGDSNITMTDFGDVNLTAGGTTFTREGNLLLITGSYAGTFNQNQYVNFGTIDFGSLAPYVQKFMPIPAYKYASGYINENVGAVFIDNSGLLRLVPKVPTFTGIVKFCGVIPLVSETICSV